MFALAAYVSFQAGRMLLQRTAPDESLVGIALAAVSLVVMPWLGIAKKGPARRIGSRALDADGTETLVSAYLSLTLLVGLGANALFGWWWANPSPRSPSWRFSCMRAKKLLEESREHG